MSQEWILDLLTDLRAAAEQGALYELAEHLDDALVIAARELRSASTCSQMASSHDDLGERLPGPYRDYEYP